MTGLTTYRKFWCKLAALLWMCLLCQGVAAQAQESASIAVSDTIVKSKSQPVVRSDRGRRPVTLKDTASVANPVRVVNAAGDTILFTSIDSIRGLDDVEILMDSTTVTTAASTPSAFNPDPQRALWLSALCPGLGQIYNRRYWKLPIVVGAFVGLSYGASWNNRMYKDYSKAYRDIMDDDPDTRSYMDFFPPTVQESDLDTSWLQKTMKNKRNYYRRYREICVIAMVGVYLINIVDAYVDASLAHFDISPDLTLDVAPSAIDSPMLGYRLPSLGIQCAINF